MATKKFKCKICGYVHEGDKAPEKCPQCQQPDWAEEIVEAGAAEAKPKKKGLDTNSNTYTIVYASVMVIIVAFLLAFVASSLKDIQDANVARDKKGQILSSVNLRGVEDVDSKYAEVITENTDGTYTANVDGAEKLIVPLNGAGLWGPIWGYISVDKDGETVYGAFFNHEGETAGLGARIVEEWFQTGFNGKKIFKDGSVALGVVKKGKYAETDVPYVVDAVTGATLTSNGVNDMLQQCIAKYADAINAFKGGEAAAEEDIPAVEEYEKIETMESTETKED